MDGLVELQLQVLAEDMRGQIEEVVEEQERRNEDQGLDETSRGGSFGAIAQFGGDAQREDREQNRNGPEFGREVQRVARVRVLDRLREFIRW